MSSFNPKYIWQFLAFLTIFDILHARKTSEQAPLRKLEILFSQIVKSLYIWELFRVYLGIGPLFFFERCGLINAAVCIQIEKRAWNVNIIFWKRFISINFGRNTITVVQETHGLLVCLVVSLGRIYFSFVGGGIIFSF